MPVGGRIARKRGFVLRLARGEPVEAPSRGSSRAVARRHAGADCTMKPGCREETDSYEPY
jgi:hypothetical protein